MGKTLDDDNDNYLDDTSPPIDDQDWVDLHVHVSGNLTEAEGMYRTTTIPSIGS